MIRAAIGGALDLAALSGREFHGPRTGAEIRAAVHELAARGMSDYDIAHATDLAVELVRRMLGEPTR